MNANLYFFFIFLWLWCFLYYDLPVMLVASWYPSCSLLVIRKIVRSVDTFQLVTVVLVSTVSIPVVVVWPVVFTIIVPIWTDTILVTSVNSVCVTSTSPINPPTVPSSIWIKSGLWLLKKLVSPAKLVLSPSLIPFKPVSVKFWVRVNSPTFLASSRLVSSPVLLKKKSNLSVVLASSLPKWVK